jgi:hypothetical protein
MLDGHRNTSAEALRQICNIPSTSEGVLTLGFKFCLRLRNLPPDCLLLLLAPQVPARSRLSFLKRNPLFLTSVSSPLLKPEQIVLAHRQTSLTLRRTKKVLLRGCRQEIGIDPILLIPATRRERSRLIRWRIGWLSGQPRRCPCLTPHHSDPDCLSRVSRPHLLACPLRPRELWDALPPTPADTHMLEHAISQIPSFPSSPPPYWSALLSLLYHIDQLCLLEGTLPLEPSPGALWLNHNLVMERLSSPLL